MMAAHLIVAVAAGLTAAAAAVVAGQPWWVAGLLYVACGNLSLLASVAALLREGASEPA